tara:strand:- start:289 stop:606 length:318 start_codon:yes stop_codon:yes gene_type:complete
MMGKDTIENMRSSLIEQRDEGLLIDPNQLEILHIRECEAQSELYDKKTSSKVWSYDNGNIVDEDGNNAPADVDAAIRLRVKQRSANESHKADKMLQQLDRMEKLE